MGGHAAADTGFLFGFVDGFGDGVFVNGKERGVRWVGLVDGVGLEKFDEARVHGHSTLFADFAGDEDVFLRDIDVFFMKTDDFGAAHTSPFEDNKGELGLATVDVGFKQFDFFRGEGVGELARDFEEDDFGNFFDKAVFVSEFERVFEMVKIFVNAALVFAETFFRHFELLDVGVVDGGKEKVVADGAGKDADGADVTVNSFGKSSVVGIIETGRAVPFGKMFKLHIVNKPGSMGGESF